YRPAVLANDGTGQPSCDPAGGSPTYPMGHMEDNEGDSQSGGIGSGDRALCRRDCESTRVSTRLQGGRSASASRDWTAQGAGRFPTRGTEAEYSEDHHL